MDEGSVHSLVRSWGNRDVQGLLMELLLMVVIDGLSDAPSRQDCKWYAVSEVLMTALKRSTILGPCIYDEGSCT